MPEPAGTSRNTNQRTPTVGTENGGRKAPSCARVPAGSVSETHSVVGPPGTGKTQYVARQVALAVEAGETPTVVSLTRTAAKEAAGRVPLSRDRVSTLHSQAYRALGTPEIADTPKNIKRWNETHPNLRICVSRDLDEDNVAAPAAGVSGDDLMMAYQSARARRRPISSQPGRVQRFAALWEAWKRSEGMLD